MDGAYCFTICGNPLYFAPEVVVQHGYDYAADLWAFGITLYETYEGCSPFGNNDTEETSIFRSISSFHGDKQCWAFTDRTPPPARQLLQGILQVIPHQRCGYKLPRQVMEAAYFAGAFLEFFAVQLALPENRCLMLAWWVYGMIDIDWAALGTRKGAPIDIQPSVDLRGVLDDSAVQAFASPMFDKF
jgi:hypothetical protein